MWPQLQENHWHYLLGAGVTALLYFWLRSELTPKRVMSVFETEGVLSARQIAAWVIMLFSLCMLAAGRISVDGCEKLLIIALGLFAVGAVPKVAERLKAPTTIKAETAQVDAPGSTIVAGQTTDEPRLAGYSNGKIE